MRALAAVLVAPALLVVSACGGAPHDPPAPFVDVTEDGASTSAPVASGRASMAIATASSRVTPVVAVEPTQSCAIAFPAVFNGCRALSPTKITATGGASDASKAFDGDTCTSWNSGGFAPQAITIDLGASVDIDGLILIPDMTPDGSVVHKVEVSDDGVNFEPSQSIQAPMSSGVAAELKLPRRERARFVRFRTESSPSWIAWREIAVLHCGT